MGVGVRLPRSSGSWERDALWSPSMPSTVCQAPTPGRTGAGLSESLWLRCHLSVGLRGMGQAQAMPATSAGQTGAVSGSQGVRSA